MNTDELLEKINKRFDTLEQGQTGIEKRLDHLEQEQAQMNTALAHIKTAIEAFDAGQKDLRENMATKADMMDLKAEVVKKLKKHDERLDALEEAEGIPNSHKN